MAERSRNLLTRNPVRGRFVRRGPEPASILCLPNVISLIRIAFIPAILWLMLADGGADGPMRWIAAVLFIVAIATDAIDGHIARSRGLITDFGIFLDPVADKGVTGAALIGLTILGELPWWVTALILLREIGITVFRAIVLADRVIPASRGGKLKTTVQAVAISLAMLPLWVIPGFDPWIYWVDGVLMTLATVLTVVTGADYLWQAWRQNRGTRAGHSGGVTGGGTGSTEAAGDA